MNRVLLMYAHPALEKSRVNAQLLETAAGVAGITLHDLYQLYPDYDVDVKAEQKKLSEHDVILLQHPFYWYSPPPLVKQWEDLVLEHGWAYGQKGKALTGKKWMHVISTGGPEMAYQHTGWNRFTVREFLRPLEQTALLCGMHFLPPYLVQGTHRLKPPDLARHRDEYRRVLERCRDGLPADDVLNAHQTFNALLAAEGTAA